MGYGKYVLFRIVNLIIVLGIVTLMTAAIFDSAMTQILEAQINEMVQNDLIQYIESMKASGKTPTQEELREYEKSRIELYRKRYGLDKPFWIRILYRVRDVMTFNLGEATSPQISFAGSREVKTIILGYLPNTVFLFTTGTLITILIGLLIGLQIAKRVGSFVDRLVSILAMVSNSLPMWWTGLLLIFLFAFQLRIFPAGGLHTIPPPEDKLLYIIDFLWHLTLPLLTIVLVSFGGWAYIIRNLVIGTLQQDFVMAARAKGIPERKVLYGHVLRAVSPSIVTMSILSLVNSLWGAMITEGIFNWPGIGRLYWVALETNDMAIIIGLTYVFTLLWLVALIIIDLLYGLLDPRVKVGIGTTSS